MKKHRNILTLVTAAIVVLILVLYMVTYVVRESEVAVLTTFGKVVRVVDKPGLYWKAPRPIQTVVKFDARLHVDEDRFEETKTSDGVLLVLLAYYMWKIEEPERFYTKFYTRERTPLEAARRALGDLVRDAKDDVFGQYSFADLMPRFRERREGSTEGETEESRTREIANEPKFREIEDEILGKVVKKARAEYGIAVKQVGIIRFELPQETTLYVFKRMREEREKVAAGIRESGEGEASRIRSQADARKDQIIAEARAEAERLRTLGDAEAAAYYDEFAKNPELHNFLRSLKSLEVIIDEGTTVILDTEALPFKLLREIPRALFGTEPESEEGS